MYDVESGEPTHRSADRRAADAPVATIHAAAPPVSFAVGGLAVRRDPTTGTTGTTGTTASGSAGSSAAGSGPSSPGLPLTADALGAASVATIYAQSAEWWASLAAAAGADLGADPFASVPWALLTGPFQCDWFKAKDCLALGAWPDGLRTGTPPPLPHSETVMKSLTAMRSLVVAVLKEQTRNAMPEVARVTDFVRSVTPDMDHGSLAASGAGPADDAAKNALTTYPKSNGSAETTSDVDISSSGSHTEIAVDVFNEILGKQKGLAERAGGVEPGTLLDVNVYAIDFMFGKDGAKQPKRNDRTREEAAKNPAAAKKVAESDDRRADDQDIWSMVHMRRYMKLAEWDAYSKRRLDPLPDGSPKRAKAVKDLAEVERRFATFDSAVKDKIKRFDEIEAEFRPMTSSSAPDSGPDATPKDPAFAATYAEGKARMRASNRLYEEVLADLKTMRLRLDQLETKLAKDPSVLDEYIALAERIASETSRSLTFANEVYSAEGSVHHVVMGMQSDGAALSHRQYLQSFNEQTGDALKEFEHFEHYPEMAQYGLYKSGKYIHRMVLALTELAKAGCLTDAPVGSLEEAFTALDGKVVAGVEYLRDLGRATDLAKPARPDAVSATPGRTVGGVGASPSRASTDEYFGSAGAASLTTARDTVTLVASAVASAYHEPRAAKGVAATAAPSTDGPAARTAPTPPPGSIVERLLAAARSLSGYVTSSGT